MRGPVTFGDGERWGSRPTAKKLAGAGHRQPVQVTGTVTAAETRPAHAVSSLPCERSDGTASVPLLWLAGPAVPGVEPGVRATVEATARLEQGKLVVWNPICRLPGP